MRKIIIIVIMVVMTLALLGLSWEGEVDPTRFQKWKMLEVFELSQPGCYLVFVKNPNANSFIEKASLRICDKKLMQYRYFKLGEPYVFEYNAGKDGYYKQNLGKKQRRLCFGCHPEQRSKVRVKEIDI